MSDTLFQIKPSKPRRAVGAGLLLILGVLLLYISVVRPPADLGLTVFLVMAGLISCFGGYRLWSATENAIELTEQGLRLSDGTEICHLDNMVSVDRGAFAFKPSNGFRVALKARQDMGWGPGLWWRFGRNVGIGGVTRAAEARIVADALSAMIAARDSAQDADGAE